MRIAGTDLNHGYHPGVPEVVCICPGHTWLASTCSPGGFAAVAGEGTSASSAREQGNVPKALRSFSQDGGQAGTLMQGGSITFSLDAGRGQSSACAGGDTQGTEEWPRDSSS